METRSHGTPRLPAALLFVVFAVANGIPAPAVVADLETLVGEAIIAPELPLAEVRAFTETRVPALRPIDDLLEWERERDRLRRDLLDRVVLRGEARSWSEGETRVEWLETIPGSDYRIRKLRFEAVPGLWIPALLYEPAQLAGRVPVVLNVNGHDGAGKAAPYKQIRCVHQARSGMLALNVEWLGMGQLRTPGFTHYKMNQLDLCGTSGLAPFYLSMKRSLDVLLAHPHADPERVAVAGLSGGGWQTILISALDERVTLSNPVAGYSSYRTRVHHVSDLGDSEQTPVDIATVADYTHLTAMRAPRPTLLTYNSRDNCCFKADHALPPLLAAARPVYRLYGLEQNLTVHVNREPGTHNFEADNRAALYREFARHFFGGGLESPVAERAGAADVRSADELTVTLPADNADFHRLALRLSESLPPTPPPAAGPGRERWRAVARERLWQTTRAHRYDTEAIEVGKSSTGDVSATRWQLRVGGTWTVPGVELAPALTADIPHGTTIVLGDDGRGAGPVTNRAAESLKRGQRVLAVDPFYFGESRIRSRDHLYALLVSAVGERPLGVAASQLNAVARWVKTQREGEPVHVLAIGPRTSLIALVAAALEPQAIDAVELTGGLESLRDVIRNDWGVNQKPELFCFGLLAEFDIAHLAALVEPRKVEQTTP